MVLFEHYGNEGVIILVDFFDELVDMMNVCLLEYFFEHTEMTVAISRGHLYLIFGELQTHRSDILRNIHDSKLGGVVDCSMFVRGLL